MTTAADPFAPSVSYPDAASRAATLVTAALACYLVAGGILSLAGWAFDAPRLADWAGAGIAIQPNACLCVLCSGLALAMVVRGATTAATALGAAGALIAGATLVEHVAHVDLGIDTLLTFGRTWGYAGTVTPGRMGPFASVAWMLVGIGVVALTRAAGHRRVAVLLALAALMIASLAMIGYAYDVDNVYSEPRATRIALQASTFLMAAALATITSARDVEPMRTLLDTGTAGLLARRALPVLVALPLVAGFVRVEAEQAAVVDTPTAIAMLILALIALLVATLWWLLGVVRGHERLLRDTAERTRMAVKATRMVTWEWDLARNAMEAGENFHQVYGVAWPASVSTVLDLVVPEDRDRHWQQVHRVAHEGGEYAAEFRIVRPDDGRTVWIEERGRAFTGRDGTVERVVGVSIDVTARNEAQEQLRASTRRLSLIANAAPVRIVYCDRETRYRFVNDAYASALDVDAQSCIGKRIVDVIGEDAWQAIRAHIERALAGEPVMFEGEIPYPRLGVRFVHTEYAPDRDADGTVIGFVAAITDITDRRSIEE
jgi:PAS domain S-box-containing protein